MSHKKTLFPALPKSISVNKEALSIAQTPKNSKPSTDEIISKRHTFSLTTISPLKKLHMKYKFSPAPNLNRTQPELKNKTRARLFENNKSKMEMLIQNKYSKVASRNNYSKINNNIRKIMRSQPKELEEMHYTMNCDFSIEEGDCDEAEIFQGNSPPVPPEFLFATVTKKKDILHHILSKQCATVVDRKLLINYEDQFGRSSIFYAIFKGDSEILDTFFEKGVDMRKTDFKSRTVLHYACIKGEAKLIQKILDYEYIQCLKEKELLSNFQL